MEYAIGRVIILQGPFPKRVEFLQTTTEMVPSGSVFCLDDDMYDEGDIVLVSFVPDDQFCQSVPLERLKGAFNHSY